MRDLVMEQYHTVWPKQNTSVLTQPRKETTKWSFTGTSQEKAKLHNSMLTATLAYIFLLEILINETLEQEIQESILFYPILKTYPTHLSWIIMVHISLRDLDKQYKMFIQQKTRSQQLLNSLHQKPLPPNYLLSTLEAELENLDSIYTSYKPLILTVTQLLKRKSSFSDMSSLSRHTRRSLLCFLGDALSWHMGTAMTKDVRTSRGGSTSSLKHNPTTGYFSICHLDIKCHQIYHASQQTIHQCSHGSSSEDTQWCHHTFQHHQFNIYLHKLSGNTPSYLLHSGNSQGFAILHEAFSCACHRLHRFSHYWYIITTFTSSRRLERNAMANQIRITINYVPTSIIRWHPPLL